MKRYTQIYSFKIEESVEFIQKNQRLFVTVDDKTISIKDFWFMTEGQFVMKKIYQKHLQVGDEIEENWKQKVLTYINETFIKK